MSWLVLTALAQAGSVDVLVDVTASGATLRAATLSASEPPRVDPRPAQAGLTDVRVLDAEGRTLARAPVPLTLRRSVVGDEAEVVLAAGVARVVLPWPDGAARVALDEATLPPTIRPPGVPVAVQESGPAEHRLDLVLLGDGYTERQLGDFAADVERLRDYLLNLEPYGDYATMFNIWRVDQASVDSGVTHNEVQPRVLRDTAYGCFYGCGGIDRLVCCDDAAVLSEVQATVPGADGVLVLINDPVYGGAGGFQYATAYVGDLGLQVAAHELGHSLVGLWDEYSYGVSGGGGGGPNCAPDSGRWSHWTDEPGVSEWPVCSYTDLVRPTDNACMMNSLRDGYCPVCRERVVLAIQGRLPGLIVAVTPEPGALSLGDEAVTLAPELLTPTHGLEVGWTLDGTEVGQGSTLTLQPCGPSGELVLDVRDATPWVRLDEAGLLRDTASWTVSRPDCPDDSDPTDSGDTGWDKGWRVCGPPSGGSGALGFAIVVAMIARRRLEYVWNLPGTPSREACQRRP